MSKKVHDFIGELEIEDSAYYGVQTYRMFQGDAKTLTNMNANEVIANIGLEILGHKKGEYQFLHTRRT